MAMAPGDSSRDKLQRVLGPLEADVLEQLWALQEPAPVRDVLAGLNRRRSTPLAYTTVMTVMSRLAEKGLLTRHREGRGYRYAAAAPDAAGLAVRSVVREFGPAAVAHFLDEARSDPELMRRLARLMDKDA